MYLHACGDMYKCTHMHAHGLESRGWHWGVFLDHSSLYLWRQGLSVSPELANSGHTRHPTCSENRLSLSHACLPGLYVSAGL